MNATETRSSLHHRIMLAVVAIAAALGISITTMVALALTADAEDNTDAPPTITEVDPFYVEFEWVGDPGNYFFDYRSGDIPIGVSVRTSGITSTDEISVTLSDPFYSELFQDFDLQKGFVDDLFAFLIVPDESYQGAIPDEPIEINVTALGGNTQSVTIRFIEQ